MDNIAPAMGITHEAAAPTDSCSDGDQNLRLHINIRDDRKLLGTLRCSQDLKVEELRQRAYQGFYRGMKIRPSRWQNLVLMTCGERGKVLDDRDRVRVYINSYGNELNIALSSSHLEVPGNFKTDPEGWAAANISGTIREGKHLCRFDETFTNGVFTTEGDFVRAITDDLKFSYRQALLFASEFVTVSIRMTLRVKPRVSGEKGQDVHIRCDKLSSGSLVLDLMHAICTLLYDSGRPMTPPRADGIAIALSGASGLLIPRDSIWDYMSGSDTHVELTVWRKLDAERHFHVMAIGPDSWPALRPSRAIRVTRSLPNLTTPDSSPQILPRRLWSPRSRRHIKIHMVTSHTRQRVWQRSWADEPKEVVGECSVEAGTSTQDVRRHIVEAYRRLPDLNLVWPDYVDSEDDLLMYFPENAEPLAISAGLSLDLAASIWGEVAELTIMLRHRERPRVHLRALPLELQEVEPWEPEEEIEGKGERAKSWVKGLARKTAKGMGKMFKGRS